MSGELGVYASFLKDSLYATCVAFLFWITKWDVQWVFFCHALTWAAFPLFYSSDDTSFWAPTGAAIITLVVASLDAFALLNVMCYLPHVDCCIGDDAASPFTLGAPVCGPNERYDPLTLAWLAIATLGLGVLSAASRVVGLSNTRKGTSVEASLAVLYVLLKVYLLCWHGITYTAFFFAFSALTMLLQLGGAIGGFAYRFAAVLTLLACILVDLLAVLGITRAITAFEAVPSAVRAVWVALHILLLTLSGFQILGWLTRPNNLPGPWSSASRAAGGASAGGGGDDDDDDAGAFAVDTTGDKGAVTGAARFSGYGAAVVKRGGARNVAGYL
jgi:hypothetical protein